MGYLEASFLQSLCSCQAVLLKRWMLQSIPCCGNLLPCTGGLSQAHVCKGSHAQKNKRESCGGVVHTQNQIQKLVCWGTRTSQVDRERRPTVVSPGVHGPAHLGTATLQMVYPLPRDRYIEKNSYHSMLFHLIFPSNLGRKSCWAATSSGRLWALISAAGQSDFLTNF